MMNYRLRERRSEGVDMAMNLIIYFSRADENYAVGYIDKGNTEIVAEFVQELTGADMFKVEPLVPYAADYNTCIKEAKERIGNAPVKEKLTDISAYDTIFIMSPIYWGTYAPEMETALQGLDFSGKIVRVISTHEGSGLANMVSDVKKMCVGADVQKNGLAIRGSQARNSRKKVAGWL
ncbi:MAG: flavodoxin [Eubacteriales bacterium]|nr:flavodoxin [Eubacteriales bacterium]